MGGMKDHAWLEGLRRERLQHSSRNPGLAALMSFFVMGLGQIYAGHIDKGIILLCAHFGGLLAGYSIYTQGMVYEAIADLGGVYLVLPASYALSVFMILVWIYNIKDAYYLSLFSEFRDWFEVERVLVPYLKGTQVKMLAHHPGSDSASMEDAPARGGPEGHPRADGEPSPGMSGAAAAAKASTTTSARLEGDPPSIQAPRVDKPEIIDVTATVKPSTAGADPERSPRRRLRRPSRTSEVLEEPGTAGSGKMILAVGTLVVLVGIWVSNLARRHQEALEPRATLFSLSGELRGGGAASGAVGSAASAPPVVPPDSSAAQIQEGMALLDNGDTASGIAILEATLPGTGRSYPDAWKALAKIYFDQDQASAYEDCLQRYLGQFPEDTEAWVNLAKVQVDRQSFVTASRSLLKALNQAPAHQRANFLMGSIYRELGLAEEAVPYLTKALLDDPLNTEYNRELAAVHLDLRDLKAARRHLDRVVSVTATTGIRDEEAERLVAELERLERLAPPVTYAGSSLATVVPPAAPSIVALTPPPAGAAVVPSPPHADVGRAAEPSATPPAGEGSASADGLPMPGGAVLYEAPGWSPKRRGATTAVRHPPATAGRPILDVVIGEILPADSALASLLSDGSTARPALASLQDQPANPVASPSPSLQPVAPVNTAAEVAKAGLSPLDLVPASPTAQVAASAGSVNPSPATEPLRADPRPAMLVKASGPAMVPRPPALDPAMGLSDELANAVAIDERRVTRSPASPAALAGARVLASATVRPAVRPVTPVSTDRHLKGLWAQGFDRYLAGKWEEALPFFLDYLEKKPDPRVYDMVGLIFEKVGLEQDAFEATMQSYRLGHKDAQTLVRLGLLAEKTGKFAQGATFLCQALAKLPHRIDLALSLARCHRQAGQVKAARTVLEKIAADPHQSYAVKRRIEAELASLGAPAGR